NPDLAPPQSFDANKGADLPAAVRWRVLAVLLTVIFMALMNVSIVNVALPSIQHALDASQSDIQWVLSGYALTFGVVLVAAGRAGDILGRGGIFVAGLVLFVLSSIAAGFAPDALWLNVARFVQGVASGLVNPQGVGMIQQYFRGAERGQAFGYFGTAVGLSVAIGPVLGGLLIDMGGPTIGWRLTFLVNVPIGILAIVLAWRWFPRPLFLSRQQKDRRSKSLLRELDPVGSLLLGLAVLAVLFPFVESQTGWLTWLLLPLGLVLVYLWVHWERFYERRGNSPMVNLAVFSTPSFTNGTIIMTLYFLGMTSIWVLVPLYAQEALQQSAVEAGSLGIPSALVSAYSAHWSGKRVASYGRRIVIAGLFLAIGGLLSSILVIILSAMGYISIWWLLLSLSLIGAGQGSVISPNQALTLADVPLDYAGSSGAIMQTGQRIGTSVGLAIVTAAVFACLQFWSWSVSVVVGFVLIASVVVLALLVAFKDLRDRRREGRAMPLS
ncbi:MAG TPA: MFS transporter, partial [Burkholderiaceae bacterium]|nr:MFS transporter [Burkholderiaceae bacterium]